MAILRPAGDFDTTYAHDLRTIRQPWQWVTLFAFIIALYTLPFYANQGIVSLVNRIGITIIAVQGLSVLTGYTGQISLGQAAFMTTGGYISALLVTRLGWSFFAALPAAALGAGLIGLLFGLPSLRVKGFYLAMSTLAAQFIIPWFTRNAFPDILNGAQGLNVPVPILFGLEFNTPQRYIYITITVLIITTIAAYNITRSRLGRAFVAIRDHDLAAELLGVNPFRYKLQAFFLASMFAGIDSPSKFRNFQFDRLNYFPGNVDHRWIGLQSGSHFRGHHCRAAGGMGHLVWTFLHHNFPHHCLGCCSSLEALVFWHNTDLIFNL